MNKIRYLHTLLLILVCSLLLPILVGGGIRPLASSQAASIPNAEPLAQLDYLTFLPYVDKDYPWANLFGVEAEHTFHPGNIYTNYAIELQSGYARLNGRISWRLLQPSESEPINWGLLANFEDELRTLRAANIRPILVVDDYPLWATDNTVRDDGQPTSCGPLLPERYDDFAIFVQALVSRYMQSEFNVHIWELGNEPDVDPNLVEPNNIFGCWGDRDELFYNGDAYGHMLITVSQAIKSVDSHAQIWIGGLLLGSPNTIDPGHIGRPEYFLNGILEAGAAPYIDVISFHAYLQWNGQQVDQDVYSGTTWDSLGGVIRGKAAFLRTIMAQYGVNLPLFISETGLICSWCQPWHYDEFADLQADVVPRSFPRAMADNITGYIWFTLDGPGWRMGGLLDENQQPKPVFFAYRTFMQQIYSRDFLGPVYYGSDIESYRFVSATERVDIVFSILDTSHVISLPQNEFIAAYDRFGVSIVPTPNGPNYDLTVLFEPIYIIRTR